MKQKRMSVEQYLQIGKWLENNKAMIETRGHSQREVQILMSSALGYDVPLSSLIRCAKALAIEWAGSPPKPPPVPIGREAIMILIGALEGLYVETGKTIPNSLGNLHSAYAKEKITDELSSKT